MLSTLYFGHVNIANAVKISEAANKIIAHMKAVVILGISSSNNGRIAKVIRNPNHLPRLQPTLPILSLPVFVDVVNRSSQFVTESLFCHRGVTHV